MKITVDKWNKTQKLISQTIKSYENLPTTLRPPLDKVLKDCADKVNTGTISIEEVLSLIAMLYWRYLLLDQPPIPVAQVKKPTKAELEGKVREA